ncbi:MAG: VWA domain-containing protein [Bacteroidales bacterium]|jgi:Ca-activated chloride channel family protein|nr:VWA domain-containing protein [Bacteroidales bacterium]
MFRFANDTYLYLLLLIPVLVLVHYLYRYFQKRQSEKIGDLELIKKLSPSFSKKRLHIKFWIWIVAILFVILALARPQLGSKVEKASRRGVDLMICMDVSRSMLANDISPNRMERAKQALNQLVNKLENDRIGIVVFAGKSFIQLPITNDFGAAKMFIDNISTNLIGQQGTALGSAIDLALTSFDLEEQSLNTRAIIAITDGENFEDDAVASAKNAVENGVRVHAIGVGTTTGTTIPVLTRSGNIDYHRDRQGNVVVTKLDETYLQKVIAAGKGAYVRATNADMGLDKIMEEIDKMEKKDYDEVSYTDYEDIFMYFLIVAFVLLIIDQLLLARKNRFSGSIKLFKNKHI